MLFHQQLDKKEGNLKGYGIGFLLFYSYLSYFLSSTAGETYKSIIDGHVGILVLLLILNVIAVGASFFYLPHYIVNGFQHIIAQWKDKYSNHPTSIYHGLSQLAVGNSKSTSFWMSILFFTFLASEYIKFNTALQPHYADVSRSAATYDYVLSYFLALALVFLSYVCLQITCYLAVSSFLYLKNSNDFFPTTLRSEEAIVMIPFLTLIGGVLGFCCVVERGTAETLPFQIKSAILSVSILNALFWILMYVGYKVEPKLRNNALNRKTTVNDDENLSSSLYNKEMFEVPKNTLSNDKELLYSISSLQEKIDTLFTYKQIQTIEDTYLLTRIIEKEAFPLLHDYMKLPQYLQITRREVLLSCLDLIEKEVEGMILHSYKEDLDSFDKTSKVIQSRYKK